MNYANGTNFAAYAIAAAMLTVAVVTQLAALGKIRRNGFIGIRIPPTLAGDAAWIAGHRAAVGPTWSGCVAVTVAAAIAQVTPAAMVWCIVLLGVFLLWALVAAWRAAVAVTG